MRAILLAAGQGKRLQPLTDDVPKCLMPLNSSTILQRLIEQLIKLNICDITVVVGYKASVVVEQIQKKVKHNIKFIKNCDYEHDVNILSLSLALKEDKTPFYLIEADCVFDDKCVEQIVDSKYDSKSIWYSSGDFTKGQHGGIIKSDAHCRVNDVRIVKSYEDKYHSYKKMIGALKVGPNEIDRYCDYLFKACKVDIAQYYHMPWIEHIDEFESYLCDLSHFKAGSFNTIGDYYEIREIFRD